MILDDFKLNGKVALVTGSSRGLGAAIALALAEAGAQVALHGSCGVPEAVQQTVAHAAAANGMRTIAVNGDVSEVAACVRMVDEVVSEFGHIDILINNAGTIRRAPAVDHSMEDWTAVLNTNLTSVFRLTQLAGRHMLAKGTGKVINIASLLTFQGGVFVPGYAAAKGGVGQLTRAFANEWASKGINVNAVAPGYMETDNTETLRKDGNRSRQILERIPAGRWGAPADLAGAAVFLASQASNYIHGQILVVDGGWLSR